MGIKFLKQWAGVHDVTLLLLAATEDASCIVSDLAAVAAPAGLAMIRTLYHIPVKLSAILT
jgi:hypothetical protein